MAFPNPPKTWSAAAVLTAAQLNAELRDALNALLPTNLVAWTSYTPTLTQSATVTKTVTYAKYTQIGRLVVANVKLTVTGSGTANNTVIISLPVTAVGSVLTALGSGFIVAAANYPGIVYLASSTTVAMLDATAAVSVTLGQTGAAYAVGLANTNIVSASFAYEV